MELADYRCELVSKVQEKAMDEELLDQEAFFQAVCEMLRDSEAISDFQPIDPGYRFGMGTNRFMAIDGYDQSAFEMDESIVVITCDDYSSRVNDEQLSTIQARDCMKYINGMQRYIQAAWNGSFLEQAEESSAAWEFASFINENKSGISRFRLYFVTDREYTGRDDSIKDPVDFYSKGDHHVSLEAHVWDLRHLMEAAQAADPLEHLTVNLGDQGMPAVKSPDADSGMETYLMFVPGQMLADWYKKHGSKLMEANVRSFLSLRGKVNRGIRNTLDKEPDRFVAYNNGLSATASSVDMDVFGNITSIHDLQIVNGGQTTASIFYSQKKDGLDLSKVVVPVKLVVVREDVAHELVPNISRYTNSQNKVAETDFSSNSEYQVKLDQLSQQVLTPPLPGKHPTHWFYERTRGQYDNEKNRRDSANRKQFEKLNPSKQRIKMIDAPKYLMCWDGLPYIASLGSQKCFARFVEIESQQGQESVKKLDQTFFKQLVCKRIIFDTTYKYIKKMDWYRGAYQTNIAEYAVAKYALDLKRFNSRFDFDAIWRRQCIDSVTLGCLLEAAKQASDVLNDPNRSTQNVSEWAKKESCWDMLRRRSSCLNAEPIPMVSPISTAKKKTVPTESLRENAGIKLGATVPDSVSRETGDRETGSDKKSVTYVENWRDTPAEFRKSLTDFSREHHLMSPKTESSLDILARGGTDGVNSNALNHLLENAIRRGFHYAVSNKNEIRVRVSTQGAPSARKKIVRRAESASERDISYQRDFLMEISAETWKTILEWAQRRYLLSGDVLAIVAKIDKQIRLTDEQTQQLWAWRGKVIKNGFSASQFAPLHGVR